MLYFIEENNPTFIKDYLGENKQRASLSLSLSSSLSSSSFPSSFSSTFVSLSVFYIQHCSAKIHRYCHRHGQTTLARPPPGIACLQKVPTFPILSGCGVVAALKRARIHGCPIVVAQHMAHTAQPAKSGYPKRFQGGSARLTHKQTYKVTWTILS